MIELQNFEDWARDNYSPSRPEFLNLQAEPEAEELTDFNTWTVDEWIRVPGIGEKLAQRLVESGPFNSVEDIGKVKGISEKVLGNVRQLIF